MPGNSKQYNRQYYRKHREKILANRRKKYIEDKVFAEKQRNRSRKNMQRLRESKIKEENKQTKDRGRRPYAPKWYSLSLGEKSIDIKMYSLGALAAKMDRKAQTLRLWEKIGVLPQAMFRDTANRRMYTADQVEFLVNAYKDVIQKKVGTRWLADLKEAFYYVWRQLPRGIQE